MFCTCMDERYTLIQWFVLIASIHFLPLQHNAHIPLFAQQTHVHFVWFASYCLGWLVWGHLWLIVLSFHLQQITSKLHIISTIVCYTSESACLYAMNLSYQIRQNNCIRTYLSFIQRTHHEIICRLDVTFKKPKSTWLQKPWITQVGCIWSDLTIDQ